VAARLALAHALPPALSWLASPLHWPVKYGATTPLDLDICGLKLRLLPRGNLAEQKLHTAPQLFDRKELALLHRRSRPKGLDSIELCPEALSDPRARPSSASTRASAFRAGASRTSMC
jgi:hypothetical protein